MSSALAHPVISFVRNHQDDMHCVGAVFRMVHQYFLGSDLSYPEFDVVAKAVPGRGTWTIAAELEFARRGISISHIEPIDYQTLYKEGPSYLARIFGKNTSDFYLQNTNIVSVLEDIPEFLREVNVHQREGNVQDILDCLNRGGIVGAEVQSGILNRSSRFSLHYVLIYGSEGSDLLLHDPGLPPYPSRRVSLIEFESCFTYPGGNPAVTLFESV